MKGIAPSGGRFTSMFRASPAYGADAVRGIVVTDRATGERSYVKLYEKSWAVCIGVNQYDRWPSLEWAVNDVQAVKTRLEKAGFDKVFVLTDQQASKKAIESLLGDQLPKMAGPNDRVVIYFSGHGQTQNLPGGKQKGYLIPVECPASDYFSSAISMSAIRELSDMIPAKHIFYVIDACYSGLGFTRSSGLDPKTRGYLEKVTADRAVQMVTAGGAKEQVQELNGHGVMTSYFLSALDGEADGDGDGVITGSEIGAYLKPQVSRKTENRQTPQYGRLDGEGEVVFLRPDKAAEEKLGAVVLPKTEDVKIEIPSGGGEGWKEKAKRRAAERLAEDYTALENALKDPARSAAAKLSRRLCRKLDQKNRGPAIERRVLAEP